jgi:hypothetical protein
MPYKSRAQQAAVAISMKKAGKSPKEIKKHMMAHTMQSLNMQKVEAQLMNQVTTLSPDYVNAYLNKSKPAEKAVHPDSGLLEKHNVLPCYTNKKVVGTSHNESTTTQSQSLDKAKVAYQEWQALYSRPESYWGALSTGESYQGSFGQRVCRYYESEASGHKERHTVCCTA